MKNKPEVIVVDNETNTKKEAKLQQPKLWGILFLNDDYTSADFVVDMLTKHCNVSIDEAIDIMLAIHRGGRGLVGSYTKDVAETKTTAIMSEAAINEFPLVTIVEPIT